MQDTRLGANISVPRYRTTGNVTVACLISAYAALLLIFTSNAHPGASQFQIFTACVLGLVGAASFVGVLANKHWWSIFTLIFGIALYFFAWSSSRDILFFLFHTIVGLSLVIYACRTPSFRSVRNTTSSLLDSNHTSVDGVSSANVDEVSSAKKEALIEDTQMPDDLNRAEILKYNLELDKFRWQKEVSKTENRFINRNIGVIITAIISCAAIIVSYLQLTMTSNNSRVQIDNEKIRSDRQFYLEATRFLLTHERDLRTQDLERVTYFRDVVVSSFPPDLAEQIASTMRDTARTASVRTVWDDGLRYLRTKAAQSGKK